MFEWLESEISNIRTRRFHLVDGPAGLKLRTAIAESLLPLPPSYKEFVLRFGNARLYRRAESDSYQIGVFAGPREAILSNGTRVYQIGFHDGATVYLKPKAKSTGYPVFEFEAHSEERVAGDFDEWIQESCAHARESYGKEKWLEILKGPAAFTPDEEEIVESRRRVLWRVLGIDSLGYHIFEVKNAGQRTLPALTVGVRSKDRRLNGAVMLRIGHIGPGQTATLRVACYKDLLPPNDVDVYPLPDPQPEDRDHYFEFRTI